MTIESCRLIGGSKIKRVVLVWEAVSVYHSALVLVLGVVVGTGLQAVRVLGA